MEKIVYINLIVVFIVLLETIGCKTESNNSEYALTIDKLYWVVGNWKFKKQDAMVFEKWTKSSETILNGMVYSLSDLDTIVLKRMRIEEVDKSIYYTMKFERSDKEISLQLLHNSSKGLMFENPTLDFPNKIIYANTKGDMLLERFEGIVEGKVHIERSYMHRDLTFSIP